MLSNQRRDFGENLKANREAVDKGKPAPTVPIMPEGIKYPDVKEKPKQT